MNSRENPELKSSCFSYENFLNYLKEKKEWEILKTILKILAKDKNEKEFFFNELLPSLEEARKIWQRWWNFKGNYPKALHFLTSKWWPRFHNTFGELIIDPESHLKPLLDKYHSFISQQKKEQEKQAQQQLLETLQENLNQDYSSLYSLEQEELKQLKKYSSDLTKPTKMILNHLWAEALFNVIFSYSQIRNNLRSQQEKEDLYENGDDIQELYWDPREPRSALQAFEQNFFSQFKNLIDPKKKLADQEVQTILNELTSYLEQYFEIQFLEEEKKKQEKKAQWEEQQAQKREAEYLETHRSPRDEEGNILPIPTAYHSWFSPEE